MLVTGRSFDRPRTSPASCNTVLNRYVAGVGTPPELRANSSWNLPPAQRDHRSDIVLALSDRADAIEQRARELTTIALNVVTLGCETSATPRNG